MVYPVSRPKSAGIGSRNTPNPEREPVEENGWVDGPFGFERRTRMVVLSISGPQTENDHLMENHFSEASTVLGAVKRLIFFPFP